VAIGARVGIHGPALVELRRAALLHDLGKLGVSNLILDKPGHLTAGERVDIDKHPEHTRELLARVTPFRELADDAAAHHEKLDGSGYPLGLRGDELTQTARILVVADIFEAMTAARPYRGPLPAEVALRELEAVAGTKLDDRCVAAVRELVHAGFA